MGGPTCAALATPLARRGRAPFSFTWINAIGPAALHSYVMATPNNRPLLKICPSCGITMVVSQSHLTSRAVDTWMCLRCDFEIAVRPPEPHDRKAEPHRTPSSQSLRAVLSTCLASAVHRGARPYMTPAHSLISLPNPPAHQSIAAVQPPGRSVILSVRPDARVLTLAAVQSAPTRHLQHQRTARRAERHNSYSLYSLSELRISFC
jgi:hypothetical protein